MARSFLTPINLNGLELQNFNVQNLGTAPSSPTSGRTYYDTTAQFTLTYNGSAWINPLARANHTGTQVASTISNLQTTVQAYSLSGFAAPATNIAMAGFTFTGLATPTAAGQAAEYSWVIGQVQNSAAGISSKPPVQAVATSNNALSGLSAVDGYTPVAGDRILVAGQTTASANGVYNAASGAWTRTTPDGSGNGEIENGATWLVLQGTTYGGTQWRVSQTGAITVGTTSLTIVQFAVGSTYAAGNGLSLTSGTFSLNPAAGGGLVSAAGGASVDTTVVARKYSTTLGDGTTTAFTVTHNLNTQNLVYGMRLAATPYTYAEADVAFPTVNTATVTFASAPSSGQFTVTFIG